jgi:hypothetical protein
MKTLVRYLSVEPQQPKFYQNGVYFPTLCEQCNTERLGADYDPALIEISNTVRRIVRVDQSGLLRLPPKIRFPVKVQRVARAVVGHLLAVLPYQRAGHSLVHAPFPDAMRAYFLDPSQPLPKEMNIYYWIYPSNLHVVARGFGVTDVRSLRWVILGDVLKFFPLGYWVTWSEPPGIHITRPKLIANRSSGIDDEEMLTIPLRHIPSLGWPERPGTWGINLVNETMTFVAYPRKRSHLGTLSKRLRTGDPASIGS